MAPVSSCLAPLRLMPLVGLVLYFPFPSSIFCHTSPTLLPPLTILHRPLHASSCADEDFVVFVFTAAVVEALVVVAVVVFAFVALPSSERRAAHLLV